MRQETSTVQAFDIALISDRYREIYGANLSPSFAAYLSYKKGPASTAALGFGRAGDQPLFLERYLDAPIETLVRPAFDREIERDQIIEIGNFAATSPYAMIALWGAAANDLASTSEIAVATLTRPLRRMFRRIGVPIVDLAEALPHRLGESAGEWGTYFAADPRVCAGIISEGQAAISAFFACRNQSEVA
jgi:hypothetical protein